MAILTVRSLDILVAVAGIAFYLARKLELVGPVATWTVLSLFVLYLGWFLKRRSPYSQRSKPGHLHLRS